MCVLELFGVQIECVRGNNGGVILRVLDKKSCILNRACGGRRSFQFADYQ